VTKTEMRRFRTTLLARRAELSNMVSGRDAIAVEMAPNELDRTQRASERELEIGHLERESNGLREVCDALCRIDTGAFGICLECGQDIKPKRLAAVPWASFCIICQEASDRSNQRRWPEIDKPLVDVA
jgi:DnaK suppressor protein